MPIERPDWGEGGENRNLVPVHSTAVVPADDSVPHQYAAGDGVVTETTNPHGRADLPGNNVNGLPAGLVVEWNADPAGIAHRLDVARQSATEVLDQLDASEVQAVMNSFDRTPQNVQRAILAEIAMQPSGKARRASDEDVRAFASFPAGAALVNRWGHNAPHKIGLIHQRLHNMESNLSETEAAAAWEWFDSLPDEAAVAALAMLAR